MSGPSAETISAAIVAWTGHGQHNHPQRDEALVVEKFGDEAALDLMPQLTALDEDFFTSRPHETAASLVEMMNHAASEFRERHPEISTEAVDALAWCYSYDWK
jgi:hypothetical protein